MRAGDRYLEHPIGSRIEPDRLAALLRDCVVPAPPLDDAALERAIRAVRDRPLLPPRA